MVFDHQCKIMLKSKVLANSIEPGSTENWVDQGAIERTAQQYGWRLSVYLERSKVHDVQVVINSEIDYVTRHPA